MLRKFSQIAVGLLLPFLLASGVSAQITGVVYRDYNGNGTRQTVSPTIEPGIPGVIVTAYGANDIVVNSTTTAANGTYSLPYVSPVRLEFTLPSTATSCANRGIDFSSFSNEGNNVRFVSASGTQNYAVNNPNDYVSSTNPMAFMSKYTNGNPLGGGTSGTSTWFVGYPYTNSGTTAPTMTLNGTTIGSTWGVAYSKQAGKVFTSAFVKRHAGLGVLGSGGIYLLTPTVSSFTVSNFYDMDAVANAGAYRTRADAAATPPAYGPGTSFSLNGANTIATFLGTTDAASGSPIGLGVVGSNTDRNLPNGKNTVNWDPAAFDQVGKVGLGDLEISDDGKYLFVINLYDRKVYRLELNNAFSPTSVVSVTSYSLPSVTVTSGVLRPFGAKFYRGKLFVGAVATAENAGTAANLNAYVFELNNATGSASFTGTPVISYALNYAKGGSMTWTGPYGTQWYPWTNNTSVTVGSGNDRTYPTPILSNIEFDEAGNMIMSFMDRSGHQWGEDNYRNLAVSTTVMRYAVGGDILVAGNNCGGTFTLENNGAFTSANGTSYNSGAANNQGPGNSEFFKGDAYSTVHSETSIGSLAYLPGSTEVFFGTMDPTAINSGGVKRLSMTNGSEVAGSPYQLSGSSISGFGKANGLGDVEIAGTLPSVEIGNRVWNDANGNGIQDAGEAGIANVTVNLYVDNDNDGTPDGAAIGTTTTNASGEWYFNNSNITGDGDPNTSGTQATLTNGIRYIVRIGAADWTGGAGTGDLANYRLTGTDITGNGAVDLSDNDASLNGSGSSAVPQISVVAGGPGQNNHNLDFGFSQLASIGDRVWLDQNGNGTQDGTYGTAGYEPGVAGVTVQLFRNGTDGLPGTSDDVLVATTVTDAYGNYLFDNLTPTVQTNATTIAQTSYNVKFTPPAKYTFTVSNTPGDNGDNTNSDANPSQSSASYGRTGGYNLTAGEAERTADAGLIFPQPQFASIGDRVWIDANVNGTQDAGEVGVSGVAVTLYRDADGAGPLPSTPYATTITDANGNYLFSNITPDATATYQVGFALPIGYQFTTKTGLLTDASNSDVTISTGLTDAFTVTTATNITTVDAGIHRDALASVGNFVWNDLDQDGVQDAGEPGIAGVTVNLYNSVGVIVATTVTNAFGEYMFAGLTPGVYEVGFVAPAGYSFSPQAVGVKWTDSDANTGTGRTGTFTLVSGQHKDDIDAGLYNNNTATLNRLGDKVWFDNNNNGIQDAGEFGAPGVSVALLDANGQPVDDPRQAGTQPYITSTDLNGNYLFTDLPNGTYKVYFYNQPSGYSFITSSDAGGATANNSDVSASGYTPTYSLTGGQTNLTVDAGLIRRTEAGTASLGNKVFYDLNSNGLQDAGETGVAGVTVTLLTPGADGILGNGDDVTVASLVTNSLGEYLFTNLAAGVYYVQFTNGPAGYNTTTANTGSDDAIDSDGTAAVTISSGTATTGLYTLATGEQNLTVDLGLVKTTAGRGSISNQVWFDTNGNGTYNSGVDAVVPGVQAELLDGSGNAIDPDGAGPLTRTITTTDVNGNYLFDNLAAGNYIVRFSNYPAGLAPVDQDITLTNNRSAANGAGVTPVIALAASQNLVNVDLGLTTVRAVLGDKVWNDLNGNGVQDSGEPGLAGVTVVLRDGVSGNPLASTVTDANGNYLFTNLLAGTYVVEFTNIPGNMTFTTKDAGSDAADSDVNPGTGRTDVITLTNGQVNLTVDAGVINLPTATVGTYVWFDNGFGGGTSGDGIAQAGEPPVAGVLATLYDAGTNQPLRSAVTSSSGEYRFTNVATGTYYVVFSELPGPGINFTTQLPGTTDSQSKANAIGKTASFTVASGDNIVYVDAGLIGTPLPATGLQLEAQLNRNTVTLNWKTQSEISTDYFEVQLSTDGQSFVTRERVTAAGFSATERTYTRNDDVASVSHSGVLYYRVKLYDINGTFRYSNVSVVRFKAATITAWPNPFAEQVRIRIQSVTTSVVEASITDLSGRVIVTKSQTVTPGVNQINISNLKQLSPGSYLLRITDQKTKEKTTYILIKQ